MATCPWGTFDWYCDRPEGHDGPHGMDLYPADVPSPPGTPAKAFGGEGTHHDDRPAGATDSDPQWQLHPENVPAELDRQPR